MLNFAWDGITSFSVKPIRLIITFGFLLNIFSLISLIIFIILNINLGIIISVIALFTSIEILCTGVIGEYIGKVYFETKNRPRYIIETNLMEEVYGK